MINLNLKEIQNKFDNNDFCLEWLKDQRYPDGIICPNCGKVTRHHRVTKRPCYVCNKCGNHTYPAVGTIFEQSKTPFKIWFAVMLRMSDSSHRLTARNVQREYHVTYKTAWRMLHKIKDYFMQCQALPEGKLKHIKTSDAFCSHLTNLKQELRETVTYDDKPNKEKTEKKDTTRRMEYPEGNPDSKSLTNSGFSVRNHLSVSKYSLVNTSRQSFQKRDRTARLLRLQILLNQFPEGLTIDELALKSSISKRTVYRDLQALESELGIPIWEENRKRGINEGYFLPPINFTLEEATNILLAVRSMQNFSSLYVPSIASTFMKLNTIVPKFLKKQISNILNHMEHQPKNGYKNNNASTLIEAWLSHHKIKIIYKDMDGEQPTERIINPYFLEPSNIDSSIYIIGFCNLKKAVGAFKFNNIIGEIKIEPDTFEIPDSFDAIEFLGEAWGIHLDNKIETVKLQFKPGLSSISLIDRLHPSKSMEVKSNGSFILTVKVRDSLHFRDFILGWGDQVEVIEPQELRDQISNLANSLVNIYSSKK